MTRGGIAFRALGTRRSVTARQIVIPLVLVAPLTLAGCARGSGSSTGALPQLFSGGLIDTEVQSDWSEGPAHFSGYQTKFTFTKLVFEPGKQGPYTLTGGVVGAESGNVIEYMTGPAPAGLSQTVTCSATFEFARKGGTVPDATLSGNIGSLSRTTGGWHATIDLGVTLPGVITSSSNCGPNNEFTDSQFGQPPKITIPITATGELNSATGVLTVDSTESVPVAGGAHQTDDMTGTLFDKLVP